MNRTMRNVLTAIGVLACIFGLLISWFLFKSASETGKMKALPTGKMSSEVFVINDTFVNTYFIKTGENYIMIDAGNNSGNIKQGLVKLGIQPDKVSAVFLTHSDSDHVAALKLFRKASVYMSFKEATLLSGKVQRAPFMRNRIGCKYQCLRDQAIINIGKTRVKCILTPGHTVGSMSYLVNNRYLFVGDAMSLKNGQARVFNDFFNMDSKTLLQSFAKLRNLPAEYVFTAHYSKAKYETVFSR